MIKNINPPQQIKFSGIGFDAVFEENKNLWLSEYSKLEGCYDKPKFNDWCFWQYQKIISSKLKLNRA